MLKCARGTGSVSQQVFEYVYPRWFGFDQIGTYYKYMMSYRSSFKTSVPASQKTNDDIINQSVEKMSQYILEEILPPEKTLWLMQKVSGNTTSEKFKRVNASVLELLTKFCLKNIGDDFEKTNKFCKRAFPLFNYLRGRTVHYDEDNKQRQYEGAFVANYVGGVAAFESGVFSAGAYLLSQADKI